MIMISCMYNTTGILSISNPGKQLQSRAGYFRVWLIFAMSAFFQKNQLSLLTFVICDKTTYFEDLRAELGLQIEMRFYCCAC